ncbi:hypothetical protein KYLE_21 [Pantoea phage Kyle]|uniref:Uncharacterized protein n=1 Tax=Pantoea phage Kyle TaxID=2589665 RepID=A0A514A8P6_9CAUD|nr:hypothetical protein HWC52_gp021 [Pantoea phage Kyle]QDH49642.1 hypothetical protein KYLE_21 [Pantoea phage Kyle]
MKTSATNQWPVEYRNGVAVGRHQPEPASTNYQPSGRGNVASAYVVVGTGAGFAADATGGPDGGAIGTVNTDGANYLISQDVNGIVMAPYTAYDANPAWQRKVAKYTSQNLSRIRHRLSNPNEANFYLYLTQNSSYPSGWLAAGDWTSSWFYQTINNRLKLGMLQIEPGKLATSPFIIEDASLTKVRAASSATVTKVADATGVKFNFSDGSSKTASFGSSNSVTVPLADADWGVKYITTIEYTR